MSFSDKVIDVLKSEGFIVPETISPFIDIFHSEFESLRIRFHRIPGGISLWINGDGVHYPRDISYYPEEDSALGNLKNRLTWIFKHEVAAKKEKK